MLTYAGTPRDVLLMRSLMARLCEHVAADEAQTKCQREEAEREWHRGYVAADASAGMLTYAADVC
jgi:hypothetical protein